MKKILSLFIVLVVVCSTLFAAETNPKGTLQITVSIDSTSVFKFFSSDLGAKPTVGDFNSNNEVIADNTTTTISSTDDDFEFSFYAGYLTNSKNQASFNVTFTNLTSADVDPIPLKMKKGSDAAVAAGTTLTVSESSKGTGKRVLSELFTVVVSKEDMANAAEATYTSTITATVTTK